MERIEHPVSSTNDKIENLKQKVKEERTHMDAGKRCLPSPARGEVSIFRLL